MFSSPAAHKFRLLAALCFVALVAFFALPMAVGFAAAPVPWGLNLQAPATPVQERIETFHHILLWTISIITVFVLALLIWVVVRYNRRMNPKPSLVTHNVKLEIAWTLIPCLILIALAFWSFPLIYYADRQPEKADVLLKVTGRQWYWTYEYPDLNSITFDSRAIWDSSDVTADQAKKLIAEASPSWLIKSEPLRLLEVDNRVVLPVGKNVHVQIAGSDVEHSWFMPSMGVNRMAVPGRLSEVWLRIEKEGVYYGQCSMICGNGHAYMPIVIEAVSPEKFAEWIGVKKTAMGITDDAQQLAAAH